MLKKIGIFNIAFVIGLIIFTVIVFNLSVGWFTVVMPIFATLVLVLILISPDEKENSK